MADDDASFNLEASAELDSGAPADGAAGEDFEMVAADGSAVADAGDGDGVAAAAGDDADAGAGAVAAGDDQKGDDGSAPGGEAQQPMDEGADSASPVAADHLGQESKESKEMQLADREEHKQLYNADDASPEYDAAMPLTKGDQRRMYFRAMFRAALDRSKLSKRNKDFGWNMGEVFYRGFMPDMLALVDRVMGQVYYVNGQAPEDEKYVLTWSPQKKIKSDYSFVPKLLPLGGTHMRWVTPILTVCFANMGMGNWKGVERERDRMYSKLDIAQAEMSIGLGTEPIDGKLVDPRTGQSIDALDYFTYVHHLMRSFAVVIVNNNLKPHWIAKCCEDIEAPQRTLLAKQRAQRLAALKKTAIAKKIPALQVARMEAKIAEETDEKQAKATLSEVVDAFIQNFMTDMVKLKSTDPTRRDAPRIPGTENVSYTRPVVRPQYTSEKQSNQPYVPPNEDFANIFAERKLVYNPPKWVNLSNWGKPGGDQPVSGMSIYDMNIWQGDRLALEISFDMFLNSPQTTCGLKTQFETVYFHSKGKGGGGNNPTPEVIPDEQRRPIEDAEPFTLGNRNPALYMQIAAPVPMEYITFVAPRLGLPAPEPEGKEAKGQGQPQQQQQQQYQQPRLLASPFVVAASAAREHKENKDGKVADGKLVDQGQKRKDPPAAAPDDFGSAAALPPPLSNAQRMARQNAPPRPVASAAGGEHRDFGAEAMMSISAAVDAPPPLENRDDVHRGLGGEPPQKKRNTGPPAAAAAAAPAGAGSGSGSGAAPTRPGVPVRSLAQDMAALGGGGGKETKVPASAAAPAAAPKAAAAAAAPKASAAAVTAGVAPKAPVPAPSTRVTAWHTGAAGKKA